MCLVFSFRVERVKFRSAGTLQVCEGCLKDGSKIIAFSCNLRKETSWLRSF